MTARLIQSIIPAERGMRQVYLDDLLWVLCGRLATRNRTLGCILTTMAALGLRLSLKKGERSTDVTWIGVKFKLVAPDSPTGRLGGSALKGGRPRQERPRQRPPSPPGRRQPLPLVLIEDADTMRTPLVIPSYK